MQQDALRHAAPTLREDFALAAEVHFHLCSDLVWDLVLVRFTFVLLFLRPLSHSMNCLRALAHVIAQASIGG